MTNKRKVLEGGGRVYMADIDVARGQEEKDKFAKQYGKVTFDLFIYVFEMSHQFNKVFLLGFLIYDDGFTLLKK